MTEKNNEATVLAQIHGNEGDPFKQDGDNSGHIIHNNNPIPHKFI